MKPETHINKLWDEFRSAINQAYKDGQKRNSGDGHAECNVLKDYSENQSWHDDLSALLGRETANERQHRKNAPYTPSLAIGAAAKLILMEQARTGSELPVMPPATIFLTYRQTAAEAEVIGWLTRSYLSQEWRMAVKSLDYAKLMRGAA